MRVLSFLSVLGLLALGACDSAQEITAPDVPEPSFHLVASGTPDGDYSMYYFDLNLQHNLLVKVGQTFPYGSEVAMCPGNILQDPEDPEDPETPYTSHNVLGDEPAFPTGAMPAAQGFGSFLHRDGWRRTRGVLFVTGACWFDEWNPDGFPESAWVTGWAWVKWRFRPFTLMLESRGFPAENHVQPLTLDRALFNIPGLLTLDLLGETHHEDGLTLIQ